MLTCDFKWFFRRRDDPKAERADESDEKQKACTE